MHVCDKKSFEEFFCCFTTSRNLTSERIVVRLMEICNSRCCGHCTSWNFQFFCFPMQQVANNEPNHYKQWLSDFFLDYSSSFVLMQCSGGWSDDAVYDKFSNLIRVNLRDKGAYKLLLCLFSWFSNKFLTFWLIKFVKNSIKMVFF